MVGWGGSRAGAGGQWSGGLWWSLMGLSCVPSGTVGVAAVTAGPGLTNTVTAVKNAQMAQSPVLLLGGAAATLLQVPGPWEEGRVGWIRVPKEAGGELSRCCPPPRAPPPAPHPQKRGALQAIDQMSLFRPLCKFCASVRRVRDIVPTLRAAMAAAQSGTPGE